MTEAIKPVHRLKINDVLQSAGSFARRAGRIARKAAGPVIGGVFALVALDGAIPLKPVSQAVANEFGSRPAAETPDCHPFKPVDICQNIPNMPICSTPYFPNDFWMYSRNTGGDAACAAANNGLAPYGYTFRSEVCHGGAVPVECRRLGIGDMIY